MDGLRGNEPQDIRRDVAVGAGPDPTLQTFDAAADDNEVEPSFFSKWTLPIGLFLLTVFTTLWAGAYQAYSGPVRGPLNFLLAYPETLWKGIPFAGALLFILTTHELGHYLLSKIHRVPASLPLFIPGPPHFIG
ncbi:MAG: site-2 protease family protein, partial [Nitrospirae bacterium]|nr:site-2 protease family protein [Nitrospirota bacterium]